MSKRRNKGRKSRRDRPREPAGMPQEVPQQLFEQQAQRLDSLTDQWKTKWPHGVDPQKMLERLISPVANPYRHGVRARSLYEEMVRLESVLTVPGLCEVE